MTMFLAPYTAIADIDGSPLDAGFLFFGEYGKDPELFPVEVFWDADFTVPAVQPIRTRNGYPVRNGSPTKVYLKTAQHSIVIKNRNSAFILVDFKNKGWSADFVVDGSGKTQQEINDLTGAPYRVKVGGYNIGERVVLANGDIVKSTVASNTVDPNSDMTGWGYANNSESIGYKNAQNPNAPAIIRSVQQELDDGKFNVKRMGAKGHATFDSTDAFLRAQEECAFLGGKSLYVPASPDPYNIGASILNVSQGQNGIGLIGEGINMTRLRWVGGAGRLINAFSNWQYGFKMQGFRLESLAANGNNVDASLIPAGSVGFHIERSQVNSIVKDVYVIGFDTNIDIGVHAQFVFWQAVQSRYGNVLLNAYGQNADCNVFDNCTFYGGKRKGVLLSAPRIIMRDCWFGATNSFSNPDYVEVTVGFQAIRPEDIGKSSSTTAPNLGHSAQHSALIRPRFERGNSGIQTTPYIVFKDIDEGVSSTIRSQFVIDNPVFTNKGPMHAIEVADVRDGLTIIKPDKSEEIPYLLKDVPASDTSIQYIEVRENKISNLFADQRSFIKKGSANFFFNSSVVDASGSLLAGSQTTLTVDAVNKIVKAEKVSGTSTNLFTVARPASPTNAKFYIKAQDLSGLGVVDLAVYSTGPVYKFRMKNIPISVLEEGCVIEIPNSSNMAYTLGVTVPPNRSGAIIFEKIMYSS